MLWAFSLFGHAPPPAVLNGAVAAAVSRPAAFPASALAMLLPALRAFGVALPEQLLAGAAAAAVAQLAGVRPASLVDLLGVFAGEGFQPGPQLLSAAAQHLLQVSAAPLCLACLNEGPKEEISWGGQSLHRRSPRLPHQSVCLFLGARPGQHACPWNTAGCGG